MKLLLKKLDKVLKVVFTGENEVRQKATSPLIFFLQYLGNKEFMIWKLFEEMNCVPESNKGNHWVLFFFHFIMFSKMFLTQCVVKCAWM